MRLVFAGTPAAAVSTLRRLAEDHDVLAVVTRPDAPVGRKRILTPSAVAQAADELGVPVIKAAKLDAEATARIQELEPELGVIVAYGGLVREPLLSTPDHGWINLHFSTLPAWRGAAPVQRALMAGETELGMSVFQLVAELDAGDVFATRTSAVPADSVADDALAALAGEGAELVAEVVAAIADGSAVATPQHGGSTYAAKLEALDGALDWRRPADEVFARYRGVTSEPGAFTTLGTVRIKVPGLARTAEGGAPLAPGALRAVKGGVFVGTGTGPLLLTRVQPAGKPVMNAADWFRGLREGARFDAEPAV